MRQHAAACSNMQQHAATCSANAATSSNMQQHAARSMILGGFGARSNMQQHAATCSNMQQRTATCSNMQQHAAACRKKQHAATCSVAETCCGHTDSSIKLSPASVVLGHSPLCCLGLHLRSPDPSSATQLRCDHIIRLWPMHYLAAAFSRCTGGPDTTCTLNIVLGQ